MEARQVLGDLGVDAVARAHPAPPVAATAEPFGYRQANGLERRQVSIELIDLEGTRQPAQHPGMHRQVHDVVSLKQDTPAVGPEDAGQEINDGGFAGAVWTDQRVTRAGFDLQREVAGDLEPPELLFQPFGFQRYRHGASLSGTATIVFLPPSCLMIRLGAHHAQRFRRWRPTSTITTSTRPIQNCQYCGVRLEKNSCSIRNTTAPINPP